MAPNKPKVLSTSAYLEHRFESEAVNNDSGPSPMDVGSLVRKGGKKGQGGKGGKKGSNAEQCTRCWKWGHQAKDCRAGKGNPQSQWDADQKKKTECYACGKMGHMAYECRSKGGKNQERREEFRERERRQTWREERQRSWERSEQRRTGPVHMGAMEPVGRSERMGERTRAPGTRVRRTHSRRPRSPMAREK